MEGAGKEIKKMYSSGLQKRTLADKAEISAQAISKYERNLDLPSSGVLIRLARNLGVKTEFFFRPSIPLEIEWLERYLAAVYQELGKHRKTLGIEELYLLKHKYGLSMQGWVYRALAEGIVSEARAAELLGMPLPLVN